MLAQLDEVVAELAGDEQAGGRFLELDAGRRRGLAGRRRAARRRGSSTTSCERHGHRGYRELCVRDPSWGDDPEGLGTIMQAMLRARLATGNAARPTQTWTTPTSRGRCAPSPGWPAPERAGARRPSPGWCWSPTGSSRGYRLLGEQLAETGRLPDADLVFFFDRSELPRCRAAPRTSPTWSPRPSRAVRRCRSRRGWSSRTSRSASRCRSGRSRPRASRTA